MKSLGVGPSTSGAFGSGPARKCRSDNVAKYVVPGAGVEVGTAGGATVAVGAGFSIFTSSAAMSIGVSEYAELFGTVTNLETMVSVAPQPFAILATMPLMASAAPSSTPSAVATP
jgi:hypothetical protein